jgi:hypothetical protein
MKKRVLYFLIRLKERYMDGEHEKIYTNQDTKRSIKTGLPLHSCHALQLSYGQQAGRGGSAQPGWHCPLTQPIPEAWREILPFTTMA